MNIFAYGNLLDDWNIMQQPHASDLPELIQIWKKKLLENWKHPDLWFLLKWGQVVHESKTGNNLDR